MMGSDGEVRCNCVPLPVVVCNCVLCVTHLRILDNGVTVHPPHGFLRYTDKRKKSVAAQSVRALRLLRAMRLQ